MEGIVVKNLIRDFEYYEKDAGMKSSVKAFPNVIVGTILMARLMWKAGIRRYTSANG